jgi:putative membrane protein
MHWIWWIIWILLLIWIFATPLDIPGQRTSRETPIGVLKKRFARGKITKEEYEDRKQIFEG